MTLNYNEDGHEYFVSSPKTRVRIPSITQIMKETGIIRPSTFEIPEMYANRGTEVHSMTELMDMGLFTDRMCSAEALPFMYQYEQFLLDHDVEYLESEVMVFDESLFIAGRYDILWKVDGDLHLTDKKTTSAKLREHVVQVSFYAKNVKEKVRISNLYLHETDYKLHTWLETERQEALEVLEAMSRCYWFAHPRDYKALRKIQEGGK
jgi:hypothetical protein